MAVERPRRERDTSVLSSTPLAARRTRGRHSLATHARNVSPSPPPRRSTPQQQESSSPTLPRIKLRIKPLLPPSSPLPAGRGRTGTPRAPTPAPAPEKGRNIVRLPARVITQELLRQQQQTERAQFGDVLDDRQANCDLTRIEASDKKRWETARRKAEERMTGSTSASASLAVPPALSRAESMQLPPTSRQASPFVMPPLRSTRSHQFLATYSSAGSPAPGGSDSATPAPGPSSRPAPPVGPQRIKTIRFGRFDIDTWYDAPFPEEYANVPDGRMWICEFCFKYGKSSFGNLRHRMKCKARHPPGDEIYRAGSVSVFEVDGRKNKIYCQNLCLLAKMFLDHKTLFYDVEPFLFYVMTEMDDVGARFVGYFSKEKRCPSGYNVSCIMTLPAMQRRGWGNLLIGFSYLLSKKEGRVGTPERPLSGLGEVAYRKYWRLTIQQYLDSVPPNTDVRLEDISRATAMTLSDIVRTLTELDMLEVHDTEDDFGAPSPYHAGKGRGKIHKKGRGRPPLHRNAASASRREADEPRIPRNYTIRWDPAQVREALEKWESKGYLKLQPEKLKWSPFIMARTRKTEAVGLGGLGATNLSAANQPVLNGNMQNEIASPGSHSAEPSMRKEDEEEEDEDEEIKELEPPRARSRPHTVDEAERALESVLTHAEQEIRELSSPSPTPGPSKALARRETRDSVTPLKRRIDWGEPTPTPVSFRRTRASAGNVHGETLFQRLPSPPQRERRRKRSLPFHEREEEEEAESVTAGQGEIVPDSTQPTPPRDSYLEQEEEPQPRRSPTKKRRTAENPPESPELGVIEPTGIVTPLSPELGLETAPKSSPEKRALEMVAPDLELDAPASSTSGSVRRRRGRPPAAARNGLGSRLGTPSRRQSIAVSERQTRSGARLRTSEAGRGSVSPYKASSAAPAVTPRSGPGRRTRSMGAGAVEPMVLDDKDDDEIDMLRTEQASNKRTTRASTRSPAKPAAPASAPAPAASPAMIVEATPQVMDEEDDDMLDAEGETEDEDAEGEPDPDV